MGLGLCRECYRKDYLSRPGKMELHKARALARSKTPEAKARAKARAALNRDKHRAYGLVWRAANKRTILANNLRNRYGLAIEDYDAMFTQCGGLCEICRVAPVRAVDHCHQTGKVRGLLCSTCNRGLGVFKDSLEGLEKACEYLKKSLTPPHP